MSLRYSQLSGNIIRFSISFLDDLGNLADPTTVDCVVGTADADAEVLEVTNDGTGLYHADWDTTGLAGGIYYCKATGAGVLTAVTEIQIRLKSPHLSV